jgi:integrase
MRASRTPGCSDLDLGASVVHVERQWDQYEGPIEPKSRSSRRTVPVLGILRDHLDEHQLRAGKCGEMLVFGRSAAVPFAPMAVGKRAKRACSDAGRSRSRCMSAGTHSPPLLIDAGANPKAIRTFMGHSKIQTTFDTMVT